MKRERKRRRAGREVRNGVAFVCHWSDRVTFNPPGNVRQLLDKEKWPYREPIITSKHRDVTSRRPSCISTFDIKRAGRQAGRLQRSWRYFFFKYIRSFSDLYSRRSVRFIHLIQGLLYTWTTYTWRAVISVPPPVTGGRNIHI